jgi:hypothetical protein
LTFESASSDTSDETRELPNCAAARRALLALLSVARPWVVLGRLRAASIIGRLQIAGFPAQAAAQSQL